MRHALALKLETELCPHSPLCGTAGEPQPYYTTVDMLVVDGEPLHDWTLATPFESFGTMVKGIDAYYTGDLNGRMFRYYRQRKSVAMTFGFHTNGTQNCRPALKDKVNIGVYCSWTPQVGAELDEAQCRFRLSAHLIPERVYDGFDGTYPIAPAGEKGHDSLAPGYLRDVGVSTQPDAASHYFRLNIGNFDVLNVSLERRGNNLTWFNAEGRLGTNGHGLRGDLVRRRASHGCPTRLLHDQNISITEYLHAVELPAFCTDVPDVGEYIIGVLAADTFGPWGEDLPLQSWGQVGPDEQPLDHYAPRREQTGWGGYRLRIHHVAYFAGVMSNGELRGACLSYGQWRSYYVDTTGEGDAVIEIGLTGAISSTYVRADAAPTFSPEVYTVRSPAGALFVTASPCDVTSATRWHFSLYLAPEAEAAADHLMPAEFELKIDLRPSSLALAERVESMDAGGRGFACCGALRIFRLPAIQESQSVRAAINVTSGRVLAVLAKWGSCPVVAEDVDGLRGECRGFCAMSWLTTRGSFSGQLYSSSSTTLVVPHGHGGEPDKRRGGHWYVAVQAMPDEAAQFELTVIAETPIYVPASRRCDRYTSFCSADSARQAWNMSGPPAPPPSQAALEHAKAMSTSFLSAKYIQELISSDIAQRMSFMVGLFFAFVLTCWCFRTWRFRRRRQYRVPHDLLSDW
jgi:hypothetical protein